MPERDQVYADEYKFLVVKTVSKWKRTFHFNLQIQKEFPTIFDLFCVF